MLLQLLLLLLLLLLVRLGLLYMPSKHPYHFCYYYCYYYCCCDLDYGANAACYRRGRVLKPPAARPRTCVKLTTGGAASAATDSSLFV